MNTLRTVLLICIGAGLVSWVWVFSMMRSEFRNGRIRPRCVACGDLVFESGYTFQGQLYCCALCVPPFLAGDPR